LKLAPAELRLLKDAYDADSMVKLERKSGSSSESDASVPIDDLAADSGALSSGAARQPLSSGIFYEFCNRARLGRSRPFVFIIDEINRGNLSKIFGELMMLIEHTNPLNFPSADCRRMAKRLDFAAVAAYDKRLRCFKLGCSFWSGKF
jgi:hypothetical protein